MGPLMKAIRHCCGMTCLHWPPHTSTLTTRLWRGCLHEHPHTPPNHDLTPLIYSVSRAYQKVSSGALGRVYIGLAGTQLHWTRGRPHHISECWFVRYKKMLIAVISSHLAAQPRRILASRTCFSVAASRGTRQERMMWSWVRLMCGKWNMCRDDSVDEERCLYRRWRVTGWTQRSRAGGYSHEYSSQIFREDSTWNPWQRMLAKSVSKSFDAICCSFWNHRRNRANCVIESDEIVH